MNKLASKYKISPKGKRKLDYPTKALKPRVKLPLIGKTIYLDVKEAKHLKRLKQDLKKLGATLEEFLSRDINYLITSQPRPRNKVASPSGDENPSPSPFSLDPSPSPGHPEDKKVTSVTRGKALAEKARYPRQTSTLLDNAEKWGVKIVTIEAAFKWIEKELKKVPKSPSNQSKKNNRTKCVSSYKIIKAPYVKLEAGTFCYRPFHLELDVWPRLNVDTPRGSCPFDGTLIKGGDESREERGELLAAQVDIPSEETPKEEKDGTGSAASTPKPSADKGGKKSEPDVVSGNRIMTAGELKRRKELKRKQERKRGYCECCHVKYEDLDKHVKEDQHRQYVKDKANYHQLDTLITSGRSTQNFLFEYLAKAAHVTSMRNSNSSFSDRTSSEDVVRRSPRKAVQVATSKSLSRSPRKSLPYSQAQTLRSPKKSVENTANRSRGSPRKSLRILTNEETPDSEPKPRVSNSAIIQALSDGRIPGSTESKRIVKDSPNPDINESVVCKESVSLNDNTQKSHDKTLSPVHRNNRVLSRSRSPVKKEPSPKKQLTKRMTQEDVENDENLNNDLNKENVSPLKQRVGKALTQSPRCKETKGKQENNNEERDMNPVNNQLKSGQVRKCSEKSACVENAVRDLVANFSEDEIANKVDQKSPLKISDLPNTDFEMTKEAFTEIVNCGKKRTQVEHSSDDFEVCFARTFENDTLPDLMNTDREIENKTFDGMVVQYGKPGITSKSSVNNKMHITENDTDKSSTSQKSRYTQKKLKKEKWQNKGVVRGKLHSDESEKGPGMKIEGKNTGKERDIFDIDEQSDVPSDFQCYDEQGKLITFSKTLAERIKERSVGRRSLVESYNVNVLFQLPSRSRSNSFSSNHSDKTTKTVSEMKSKANVKKVERKKSISSIASAKVVSKYRNRRIGLKQEEMNQTGYHGDDENEQTPLSNRSPCRVRSKKPRKKFWDYVPVPEQVESDEKLKSLPKELQALKAGNAWFSSDNSDSEPRRARVRINRNENRVLKSLEQLNKNNKKEDLVQSAKIESLNELHETKEKKTEAKSSNSVKRSGCNDSGRNEKRTQTKSNRFWYYVDEIKGSHSEKETESDMNSQIESSELKERKQSCENEKGITRHDEEAKKNTKSLKSSYIGNKTNEKNTEKSSNRYWHFVEEAVIEKDTEEEKRFLNNLPKELRLLKDAWTSFKVLNKSDRRKSRTLFERTEDSSDVESMERYIQKTLDKHMSRSRKTKGSKNAQNVDKIQKIKNEVSKRSVDSKQGLNEENVPKELKNLQFSEVDNFGNMVSKIERRFRVRGSVVKLSKFTSSSDRSPRLRKRESKVNYCDSDYTEAEFDSNELYRDDRVQKSTLDECGEDKYNGSQISENDGQIDEMDEESDYCDEVDLSGNASKNLSKSDRRHMRYTKDIALDKTMDSKTESINNEEKVMAKYKTGKYWDYVVEPENETNDKSEDENLPKELKRLKEGSFWSLNSSRRSNTNSKNSNCEGVLPDSSRVNSEKTNSFKANETLEKSYVTQGSSKEMGNTLNKDKRSKGHESDGVENSDSDRARSRSRKRKIFWKYETVPVEEDTVSENKSLPKELQILKDTWNDCTIVKSRRIRSCQSYSEETDVKNKKRSKSEVDEDAQHLEDSDDDEVVLIDEEVSYVGKNSVKEFTKKKQAIDTKTCEGNKTLFENYKNSAREARESDMVNGKINEETNDRSISPVFSVIPKSQHKIKRRKSPVFNRSPRQIVVIGKNEKHTLESSSKKHRSKTRKYVVKGKYVKSKNQSKACKESEVNDSDKEVDEEEYCSDSEEESCGYSPRNFITESNIKMLQNVGTPEKCVQRREPGSGYSHTPREKRRKQWKRKNIESIGCLDEKRRKVEDKINVDDSMKALVTDSPSRSTPRRCLLEPNNDIAKDKVKTDSNVTDERTEHAGHESEFALAWKPAGSDTAGNKCEKIKLNKSWSMLSERSVSKLLTSEDENENENFDGFTDEDKLPSDMSFEEKSEVEIPKTGEHEWVLEDEEKNDNEENLVRYVPVFFPSPNKTSNSSWNDAIEGYIENSVRHGPESSFRGDSSTFFSFDNSPRKSNVKQYFASPHKMATAVSAATMLHSPVKTNRLCSPERKSNKTVLSPEVKKVDNEIEFNFGSPQKNHLGFSPLKTVNGVVKNLTVNANLTSTPVTKTKRKLKQKKALKMMLAGMKAQKK